MGRRLRPCRTGGTIGAARKRRASDEKEPPGERDQGHSEPGDQPGLRRTLHHHDAGAPSAQRTPPALPRPAHALDVDPAAYHESNGYIIGEQGKPPDFVLEVASASTADQDTGPKRLDYEALGVAEYWRFDETGEHHKTRLAGDRLANGVYEPIAAEELADGVLQGYSAALNLFIRWEHGRLAWHDPATGQHIATFESERARAESEREARLAAETRVREMEERLGQQNA